jgi:predicted aspartyl protease
MIQGTVTPDYLPIVIIPVASRDWRAVIDTGFNGDLELPETLRAHVNPRWLGRFLSVLGAGQQVEEDGYLVDFPFDGQTVAAEATFVTGDVILIGTHLLRFHHLGIDFPGRTVLLEHRP